MRGRTFVVPDQREPLGDYRRRCDRCSWDGWLRSELSKEPQTNLIVCNPCLDDPAPSREPQKFKKRSKLKLRGT